MTEMSNAVYNELLEMLAQLVEVKTTTPEEAAQLIRDHKV